MKLAGLLVACLSLAGAEDAGVVRNLSENKFEPVPGMPSCMTASPQSGDPTKSGSVLAFKGTAGCKVPWHWHTPTEQIMIVRGNAKIEMKHNDSAVTIGPGGYARMPSKHVHQFTCTSACVGFVSSDGPFDIHYVDAQGKELSSDMALGGRK